MGLGQLGVDRVFWSLVSNSFVDDETEPAVGQAEDPLHQGCEDCTGKRPKSGGFEKRREITLESN